MFISKKICFLELEKTGISSINKFLKDHIKDGETTQPHDYVTEDLMKKKLFFIGSIRNPYDWYISRWSYGCKMKNEDSMYKNLVNKRLSYSRIKNIKGQYLKKFTYLKKQIFKNNKFWSELYSDPYSAKNFQKWLKAILGNNKKNELAEQYYFSSFNKNLGYMTFRYLIMFTKPNSRNQIFNSLNSYNDIKDFDKNFNFINYFIKIENLYSDLNKLFKTLNLNIESNLEKINSSNRNQEINYYYDDECKEIVKQCDKFLFYKYNY